MGAFENTLRERIRQALSEEWALRTHSKETIPSFAREQTSEPPHMKYLLWPPPKWKLSKAFHENELAKLSPKSGPLKFIPKRQSLRSLVSKHQNRLHEKTSPTSTEMKISKASS
jgi:hypothetical protein